MTEQIKTPWDAELREILDDGIRVHEQQERAAKLRLKIEGYRRAVKDYTCPFCGRLRPPGEGCECQVRATIGG